MIDVAADKPMNDYHIPFIACNQWSYFATSQNPGTLAN